MDNTHTEGTGDQSITYPSGKALSRNVHVRRSKRIRKSPQQCNPVFGAARERKNDYVASIVFMIQDGYINSNVDTDDIISLVSMWYAEDCMDLPSTFHMIKHYVLKYQIHYPYTPTYIESILGEHASEYHKSVYDEIQSLIRRDTWEIVSRK